MASMFNKASDFAGDAFGGSDDEEKKKSTASNGVGSGEDQGITDKIIEKGKSIIGGFADKFTTDDEKEKSNILGKSKEEGKELVDKVKSEGNDTSSDVANAVQEKKQDISDAISEKKKSHDGSGFFDNISDRIEDKRKSVVDDIKDKVSDDKDSSRNLAEKVKDKAEDVKEGIAEKVGSHDGTGFFDNVADKLGRKGKSIAEDVKDKLSDEKDASSDFVDKTKDKVEEAKEAISDRIGSRHGTGSGSGFFDKVGDTLSEKAEKEGSGVFDNLVDKVKEEGEDAANTISDKLDDKVEDSTDVMNQIRSNSRQSRQSRTSSRLSLKSQAKMLTEDNENEGTGDKEEKVKDAADVINQIRSNSRQSRASSRLSHKSKSQAKMLTEDNEIEGTEDKEDKEEDEDDGDEGEEEEEEKENDNEDKMSTSLTSEDQLSTSQSSVKSNEKDRKDTPSKKGVVDFRQKASSFDVTLRTTEGELYCNKGVLIMWCDYFKRRFLLEFKSMKKVEIDLDDDVPMEDMEELLRVIYPPNKPIDESNVESVIVLAKKFESKELARRSEGYLMKIKPSAELMLKALKYDLPAVERRCTEYLKMQPSSKWTPPEDFLDELDLASRMKLYIERIRWLEGPANGQAQKKTEIAKEKFEKVVFTWCDFKKLVDDGDLDKETILDICTEALEITSKNPSKVFEQPVEPEKSQSSQERPPFDLRLHPGADKNRAYASKSPRRPAAKSPSLRNSPGVSRGNQDSKIPKSKPSDPKSSARKVANGAPKKKSPYNTSMKKKPNTSPRSTTSTSRQRESSRGSDSKYLNDFAVSNR